MANSGHKEMARIIARSTKCYTFLLSKTLLDNIFLDLQLTYSVSDLKYKSIFKKEGNYVKYERIN